MTVSNEIEAKILRYYHVEKWRVGTIASQLSIHHSVVSRVLASSGVPKSKWIMKESILDPYLPFVVETLTKFPSLTASRLYEMVCERGYSGGPDHFRYLISLHRPKPRVEAYHRLKTIIGEQAQVDWGHFGNFEVGKAKRPVMAFVMVLSYSRKIFLKFYLNQRMFNFLSGHEAAFEAFGGIPRVLLYDNLRSAVLEREGDAIRFHPTLLEYSAHYRFEPRPVAVARGNEKGRVERAIRYIRDSFFPARVWKDIDDLNAQAVKWCNGIASNRPCPEDASFTVANVFEKEKENLLQPPDNPFPIYDKEVVKVGKTPYVRFDLNDYSVPYTYVCQALTVHATQDKVMILDGTTIIAEHLRSYDRRQQIEDPSHIKELTAQKKQSKFHRGQNQLIKAVPSGEKFLIKAAERHYSLRSIVKQLLEMQNLYGITELEKAMIEALERDVPHSNAVRLNLERYREKRNQLPPVSLDLPDDRRIREQNIKPHSLSTYDSLQTNEEYNDD